MKPILKWRGGKGQVLEELKKYITPELLAGNRYIKIKEVNENGK